MDDRLLITQGDITQQSDVAAVINAANAQLAPDGGVAGAIHRAAGPNLYAETQRHAPIEPGMCVVTEGYDLPNAHVIHCLGPRYGIDTPSDQLLADCYRCAIARGAEKGILTIASPAISTGAFGYPTEEAAHISVSAVRAALEEHPQMQQFRFVLYSAADYEAFRTAAA